MPVLLDVSIFLSESKRMEGTQEAELLRDVIGALGGELGGPSQGMFCLTPDGRTIGGQVHRYNGSGCGEHLESALAEFRELRRQSGIAPRKAPGDNSRARGRFNQTIPYRCLCPEGGLVVRVTNRFIDGGQPRKGSENLGVPDLVKQYEQALGRDVLWIRNDEREDLVRGRLPDSLARRLVLFHLQNTTYGQYGGTGWKPEEIRKMEMSLDRGRLVGSVLLEGSAPERSFKAQALGFIESKGTTVTRFDIVFKGAWREVTEHEFKITNDNRLLAVGFTLIGDEDVMKNITPGCLGGYSGLKLEDYLR